MRRILSIVRMTEGRVQILCVEAIVVGTFVALVAVIRWL
jgi:hypothetical protein